MKKKIPAIYIDTNVCRDCVKSRAMTKDTVHMMGIIEDKKWGCYTSVFSAMELTEIEKESIFFNKNIRIGYDINHILRSRNRKDLNDHDLKEAEELTKKFFNTYRFVEFVNLEGDRAWDIALKISSTSNLSASDTIHLATAWKSNCDVIVTSDEFFIKEGNKILKKENLLATLKICKPNELIKTIGSLAENLIEPSLVDTATVGFSKVL